MKRPAYKVDARPARAAPKLILFSLLIVALLISALVAYRHHPVQPSLAKATSQISFDASVAPAEQQAIRQALVRQPTKLQKPITVSTKTTLQATNPKQLLAAYVPVTNVYAGRQMVTKNDLSQLTVYVPANIDTASRDAIAKTLGLESSKLVRLTTTLKDMPVTAVAFVPVSALSSAVKLLAFDGNYYLDSFSSGAVFRQVELKGASVDLILNNLPDKVSTLKVNMTGTTALTRKFIIKLPQVKDATYFSQKIGPFLADADITHVSNEVSFQTNCQVSNTVFCAPAPMIDALKASGVNLVELTGNHNNDVGADNDTATINQYHSLGWHTVGGGLNAAEAAKPYIANQKQSKVAFLAYNDADGPQSGEIAQAARAGSNGFSFDKVKADIQAAKKQAQFVIVDVQYLECYAYPDGFVDYPVCDGPIPNQADDFHHIADLGADMVIGTQAHHPQTYEIYKGKPIYYGLGNLFFDQVEWPDTERGMILTHYFVAGKLLQTKLSPTLYDKDLQTHLTTNDDAVKFLERLGRARPANL